jgi:two-component system, OmpR family, sensor kinase
MWSIAGASDTGSWTGDRIAAMTIAELGVASGPVAVTAAAVVCRMRHARRRGALNRALHELRRPLQALVLSAGGDRGPGSHAVRVALTALDDLDREINGSPRRVELRPVDCRALVQPAVERWVGVAAATRRVLTLRWRAGSASVLADPDRVAQALDNLIDNALRHGGLRVYVDADLCATGVRITVTDTGGAAAATRRRDARHGHGLAVVTRVAEEHGGHFRLLRTAAGASATLELPLAPRAIPVARRAFGEGAMRTEVPPLRAAA